jgi:DNA-binding GntR family transcriptional regulator
MASSQEHREHRKSSRYRAIAAELQKEIRLGIYSVGYLLPTETELMARYAFEQIARMDGETIKYAQLEVFARGMPAKPARPLEVKTGSPALTMVRHHYGLREELFEVTVTTHPEGCYIYTMDMQRSRQSRI